MNIEELKASMAKTFGSRVDFYERRIGSYQLIIPILHEDGDMVEVYVTNSPKGENYVRICDFGSTLMRLSYTYDINSAARQQIFDNILLNNHVTNVSGNLYLDTFRNQLCESLLQFIGCVQKVCNMRYWSREVTRALFYQDLDAYVETDMREFHPVRNEYPLPDFPNGVDWSLSVHDRRFYMFGVQGNDKAKNVTISLLEFQKANLPFISLVVHHDMEELGKRERLLLTRNADTQYPVLDDLKERVRDDIHRLAGIESNGIRSLSDS